MLDRLLSGEVFAFLLIFTRIGAAMMLLPGIGDSYVSPRIRLLLALAIAFLVTPPLAPRLPALPASPLALLALVAGEMVVGLLLGMVARLLLSAAAVAGAIMSFQLSLSNAFAFNPTLAAQDTLPSAFLSALAVVLIFATDLHHLMILAVVDSYDLFVPGTLPAPADMADLAAHLVGRSFLIGVQIAAPFIFVGLLFQIGLGLMARVMPQVQIFFIAAPLQIILGLVVMALTLSAGMMYWLGQFQDGLSSFPRL